MGEPKPFRPVKLICGIIAPNDTDFQKGQEALVRIFGQCDAESPLYPFRMTDYYEKQMGKNLRRRFSSFVRLILPEELSKIKLRTNKLEEQMKQSLKSNRRVINIDPGYMTPSALVMATTKDFAHRIPLENGIYAHLELMFGKEEVRSLDWTYPDFKKEDYHSFFLKVRKIYLSQLQEIKA